MPEHVRVSLEVDLGLPTGTFHQRLNASVGEWPERCRSGPTPPFTPESGRWRNRSRRTTPLVDGSFLFSVSVGKLFGRPLKDRAGMARSHEQGDHPSAAAAGPEDGAVHRRSELTELSDRRFLVANDS